jgi:hypothetical protein
VEAEFYRPVPWDPPDRISVLATELDRQTRTLEREIVGAPAKGQQSNRVISSQP